MQESDRIGVRLKIRVTGGCNVVNEQDRRAVEGMARCGIDLEGLCASFPKFSKEEIEEIYVQTRKSIGDWSSSATEIKKNCS